MKKFFLVFLGLMAVGLGLSTDPINPSDTGAVQQLVFPQNGGTVFETPLYVREWFQRAVIRAGISQVFRTLLYTESVEFLDESVRLICFWGAQCLSGQLTEQEFQQLVADRMDILNMRLLGQTALIRGETDKPSFVIRC
jgi:hypothetical protein